MLKRTSKIVLLFSIGIIIGVNKVAISSHDHLMEVNKSNKLITEASYDTRKFYYNQLSLEEEMIYQKIDDSKQEIMEMQTVCLGTIEALHKDKEETFKKIEKQYNRAMWAYWLDNPMSTMWLNHCRRYISYYSKGEEGAGTFCIMIEPQGESYYDFETIEELEEAMKMVEQETKEFVEQLSGTEKEKVQKICDWLLEAEYDYSLEQPNINNVYGCIIQKKCICSGFTYAFKYVANMAGLEVISVVGWDGQIDMKEISGESNLINHAWNEVYINGRWSVADVTNGRNFQYKYFKNLLGIDKRLPVDMFDTPK